MYRAPTRNTERTDPAETRTGVPARRTDNTRCGRQPSPPTTGLGADQYGSRYGPGEALWPFSNSVESRDSRWRGNVAYACTTW